MALSLRFQACFSLIALTLINNVAEADIEKDKLDYIVDFANQICDEVPLVREQGQFHLNGEGRAEFLKLFKYFADLGAQGKAAYEKNFSVGIPQEGIVEALLNRNKCKLQIVEILKSEIFNNNNDNGKHQNVITKPQPENPESIETEDLLIYALNQIKLGNCPPSIFSPYLTSLCVQHLDRMMHAFNKRGSVKNASFLGKQDSQFGLVEAYKVNFEKGVMTWFVDRGQEGELVTFWAPTY